MKRFMLAAVAVASLAWSGCSNSSCDRSCDHVYGDCKASGETLDECKSKCESGSTTGACKNQSAYEDCVSASACVDITSTDLSVNALITCSAKCSS